MPKKPELPPVSLEDLPPLSTRLPSQRELDESIDIEAQRRLKENWKERVKTFEAYRDEAADAAERARWQGKIDDLQERFGEKPPAKKGKVRDIIEEETKKSSDVSKEETTGKGKIKKGKKEGVNRILKGEDPRTVQSVELPKTEPVAAKAPPVEISQPSIEKPIQPTPERNRLIQSMMDQDVKSTPIEAPVPQRASSTSPSLSSELAGAAKTTPSPSIGSRLKSFLPKAGPVLAAAGAAKDIYDVGSSLSEGDYGQAAEQVGSAFGTVAGGLIGGRLAGGAGALAGSFGGGMAGAKLGRGAYDYLRDGDAGNLLTDSFLLMPESAKQREKDRSDPIKKLEALRDTAKTAEEKGTLEQVIKRAKEKSQGISDEDTLAGEEKRKKELLSYERPASVVEREKQLLDPTEIYADMIGSAESRNDYNAVNKNSGAFGKYQILEKDIKGNDVHGKAVEARYKMPFKEAMKNPEIQEDYFRNVLLPQYRRDAAELAKTPQAQEKGLDEFTLVPMLQLGKGNVVKFLNDNASDNIADQMYYFQGKADQYKRNLQQGRADLAGFKAKEQELQETGRYIPYKSAQAKMDTLRSGELSMTRDEMEDFNRMARSGGEGAATGPTSYVPFKSPEDKLKTEEEQRLVDQAKEMPKPASMEPSKEIPKPALVESAKELAAPKSRLEEALELQRQYELMAGISKGGEMMGRGIAGAIAGIAPSKMSEGYFEEALSKLGKQKVEGVKLLEEEATKKEESDPTSEKSMRARESLSSVLGRDIPESMSYSDIKNLKLSDISLRASAAGTKLSSANQKRLTEFSKEIDPTRGRTGEFGELYKVVSRANRLNLLVAKGNDLTPQEMEELAIGTARILSGTGAGSRRQVEALVPDTIRGDISKIQQWVTNNPTGTNQQEFVKRTIGLLNRETAGARKVMGNIIKQRATAYKKELENSDPEVKQQFNDVYEAALKEYGLDESSDEKQLSTKKPLSLAEGKERTPGATVIMRGVKYKIGEDGRELIPLE